MREAADWLSVLEFSFAAFRLPRRLRGQSFDIVHSFLYRANILARFVAPRCGTPKVVNSIRITPDEETPMMRFLDRRTLNRVDRVCVLSEILSRDLQERLAFSPRRIIVIPNSIDVAVCDSALTTEGDRARAKLGLSPADLVVVSVGRLHRQKGFDCLLDAFRPFALEHPRGKLVIAGEGPQRQELEKKSEELRIPDRVLFTGLVPSPWPILAAADIFVLPSLYEGMPNALLEAMAAALPVVATPVGAVPEMITDGEEGLLVPPDDPEALTAALERLAWSPDLRRELGRRARERVERFYAPERTMEKLEALYESLLGEEGGP
jgi:glycosyltransferase involved in cell wall biosynthesis